MCKSLFLKQSNKIEREKTRDFDSIEGDIDKSLKFGQSESVQIICASCNSLDLSEILLI